MSSCTIYGCPRDKVYALIRSDGKISRFSFSKSVLEHCANYLKDNKWQIKRLNFLVGNKLRVGEKSRTGVYAIVASNGSAGRTLRVCYSPEVAEILSDPGSRDIYEFWLSK